MPPQLPALAEWRSRAPFARAARELVGEDGMALVELWWQIAQDPMQRTSDRLEASRLLADRGWGKAAASAPQKGDPFDLEDVEAAAEESGRGSFGSPSTSRTRQVR